MDNYVLFWRFQALILFMMIMMMAITVIRSDTCSERHRGWITSELKDVECQISAYNCTIIIHIIRQYKLAHSILSPLFALVHTEPSESVL